MTRNLLNKILLTGIFLLSILNFSVFAQSVPTVNGLFYGDGDAANYQTLGVSEAGRGTLYYNLDGDTLYIAMVVDQSVNDNVFGWRDHDTAYLQSAGWALPGGGHNHKWKDLKNSDHIQLNLSCGNNDITWKQDYLYDLDNDKEPLEADWVSDPYNHDGNDDQLPAGFVLASASSLSWDMNYAAQNSGWDITQNGNRDREDRYISPFDAASPDDVTALGYPTWDSTNNWEWAMVYEMSLDVGLCGDNPIALSVISAHNSPPKDGDNDVPVIAKDFGDAPDATYPTLLANNGARHNITINGVYLGMQIDGESDGQPEANATGDDTDGNDDEDGISFTTPFTIGENICFDATASGDGYLNAWIDFNSDGDWADSGEHIFTDYQLASGTTNLCFPVPSDAVEACTYIRFRYSSEMTNNGSGCCCDGGGMCNDDDDDGMCDDDGGMCNDDDDDGCNSYCDNDFDNDGIYNNEDDDDDNDGICDNDDDDDDNDGINDDEDNDDDNDGILDDYDNDDCNTYCDNDFDDDGINNNEDDDDDGDGICDNDDDDDDNDGINDDEDCDDDNDGINDEDDDDDCSQGSIHHISYDGPWGDGEVEDYEICLVDGPHYDYGDAPDTPYPTTEANNGARHLIVPGGVYLGMSVDAEWDGQPNTDATGDDLAGSPDDEDGVVFTTDLVPGEQACFDVTAVGDGILNAWIDFNVNGDWSDSGDRVFTDYALTTGTTNLCFMIPSDAEESCTYMRFRYTSAPVVTCDFCSTNNHPSSLTMRYTGDDCSATHHSQDLTKVNCSGDPAYGDPVYIVSSSRANPNDPHAHTWFEGSVALNGTFVIDAAYDGRTKLDASTFTLIYDAPGGTLLQAIEFHTSCSQPLYLDDQFGSLVLEAFVAESGQEITCDDPGTSDCDFCVDGNKPGTLNMMYTGEDCSASSHNQAPDKVSCSGDPVFTDPVYISVTNSSTPGDPGASVWFEGSVALNGSFDVSAANAGHTKLDARTYAYIYDSSGCTLLQSLEFHTSCSQPLNEGDQFGSLLLNSFIEEDGTEIVCDQSSSGPISFDGPWDNGEVEDYQVCITTLWDFGDAPDAPYETLLASDGARHQIVLGGVFMGATVDADADGQTSGYADGDDLWDGSDDEDGIVFTTPLELDAMACFDITVSGAGYMNAWIDMYSNNTWADPLDRIFTNKSLSAGTTNLCFYIPPDAPEGYTYMRFRFSSDNPGSGFSYTGPWNNGEVEDYRVSLNYSLSNDDDSLIPDKVDLGTPYPNPFNPSTTVDYQVVTRERVLIRVFDVNGRLIKTLVDEIQDAGYYHIKWNGDELSGGVYFLQLVNGNIVLTQKMILLK